METKEQLFKEHTENFDFASRLEFYKDEIRILKNMLRESTKDLTKKELLIDLEKLQNQLEIQENNANNISHAIRNNEKRIDALISDDSKKQEAPRMENHQKSKDLVLAYEKNFRDLKKRIVAFTVKVS